MALITITCIVTLVSILAEIVLIPVPSVASTVQLARNQRRSAVLLSLISLPIIYSTFCFPLLNSWLFPTSKPLFQSYWTLGLGVLMIIIGRWITVRSAFDIHRTNRSLDRQTTIVTNGLFRFSRNPGIVGMVITLLGLWFTWPHPLMALGIVYYCGYMHYKILLEEHYLSGKFPKTYSNYCLTTKRYL
ncbi:MAG: methyltransferase [Marinoscillum sp.]